MRARVLVRLDQRESRTILSEILEPEYELIYAQNIRSALQLLRTEQFNVIICEVGLESENMFDMMRQVKADAAMRSLPFVCFSATRLSLSSTMRDSLQISTSAMGACKFIDVQQYGSNFTAIARAIGDLIEKIEIERHETGDYAPVADAPLDELASAV